MELRKTIDRFVIVVTILGFGFGGYGLYLKWTEPPVGSTPVDMPVTSLITPPAVEEREPRIRPSTAPPPAPPKTGTVFAVLTIPRLHKSWEVKEGVRPKDIKNNPGHYPQTALPGQVGNFSIAGHRIRRIFYDIDKLKANDLIYVDFDGKRYKYAVYRRLVVDDSDWSVVAPNPEQEGVPVIERLTLTTCLKSGNQAREVVHAVLIK